MCGFFRTSHCAKGIATLILVCMRTLHSRLLLYLDAVVRLGSIRRAAQQLNVAASSINRQILGLEADIGAPLFERLPHKMRLTAAGEALIAHIRRTMTDFERTRAHLEALRGTQRGTVHVGIMGGLGADLLARATRAFHLRRPQVMLQFERFSREHLIEAVRDGRAELGLGFGTEGQSDLRALLAIECPLGAVMAPDHPLASRPGVRASDLLAQPLILPSVGMSLHAQITELFGEHADNILPIVTTNEVEIMKRLAVAGEGVAILNRLNIETELTRGELVFRPIHGAAPTQTLRLFAHRARAEAPLPGIFADTLGEVLRA
ncbi:LysR family transcriptional regulator [Tanticharoenia sakaeratensis]|uniref:LysR family protein n=1 Tax=Tanticharoenia sakaeratensis NBRC 103193 TaxID=1231623 RepID=A0A0D6ML51_9PROT|nr:LysR family transcriptional regulator [Tanticharoenia sakaeratensis]GAN54352.1 LysR family protein [Tanticharoenia sakaeratensis NBRC 103193]